MATPKWIVVGAGFSGSTVARRLADSGEGPVLVIDQRPHIAGNAFDERDGAGLFVHRHGPHIFHTNSPKVWEFLSAFTAWRPYEHRVLADLGDIRVPLPFNIAAIRMAFGERRAERITKGLLQDYGAGQRVSLFTLLSDRRAESSELARYVYDNVFLNYTLKQWGLRPEQLDRSVVNRVPIRLSSDDRYFEDRFQAMPAEGYAALVGRMLTHSQIHVELSTPYQYLSPMLISVPTVFTGAIDEYFGFVHGVLEYRSARFELETISAEGVQPVGTVNYPNAPALTRITEFKHLTGDTGPATTIAREFPCAHRNGETERYYPVPRERNASTLTKYRQEAAKLAGRVWFAGRLGDYAYYNMDQAVGRGLALVEKELLPWPR